MAATPKFQTIIVGAGLLGSSTAMHLAKLGHQDIAVMDLDMAGKLSSSELNAGGARATWDQAINVELARVTIDFLRSLGDEVGFEACGYLWMYPEECWQRAVARAEQLNRANLDVSVLSASDVQARLPFVDKLDGIAGATFSAKDGLFNPNLLKNYFREEARKLGVQFFDGHRVLKFAAKDSQNFEIECIYEPPKDEGEVKDFLEAEPTNPHIQLKQSSSEKKKYLGSNLVNCTGAWASRFAEIIGYQSVAWPVRRQISVFDCKEVNMRDYGMIIDPSGVYFHPEANNILAGYADPSEPQGYNLNYDGKNFFEEKIWMSLYNRSSKFENLKHLTGWGGLYSMTKDHTAIVGKAVGMPNVYECHGFSGRGAMQSYAVGLGLAELIATGKYDSFPMLALSADRFSRNELLPEGLLI